MALLLVVAFVVVPILEIWLIIQVGQVIGAWWTVALLVVSSVLGAWLVRREGRRTWAALQDALRGGRVPSRELADGSLVLVGGTLLLTPGFATDVLGFALVLPLTRALFRRLLAIIAMRRMRRSVRSRDAAAAYDFVKQQQGRTRPTAPGRVVPGEVVGTERETSPRE